MIAFVLTACDGGRKTIKLFEQIVELYRLTRQTLWGGRTDANLKTVVKRYMIA